MLTFIVFLPLAIGIFLLSRSKERIDCNIAHKLAMATAGISFIMSLVLLGGFDKHSSDFQYVESTQWVSTLNIFYKMGVDGISLWLVVLTTFLSILALGFSGDQKKNPGYFFGLLLVMEAGTLGVFMALDTILFYVFWELMLVPAYFLIGLWGEGKRVYATTKFVLYTLVGSLLMLVAIIWLTVVHYEATHVFTFDLEVLLQTHIPTNTQLWLFGFFFLAFAIKVPLFPFHSWLPHAYVACPIPVLILLTGAMSKTGAYGFIRFCLPLFPEAVDIAGLAIGGMATAGIVYGAWIAVAQRDLKALVAWSSISHLGFIVLGIFALNSNGVEGSVLQMVNHGIIASALFIIVSIIEKRLGTRNLDKFRGLKKTMPILYAMFMLITLAALGLPGLNGFVGEFLILMGVWQSTSLSGLSSIYVLMGGLSIVFASIYMLYMFQGAMHGKIEKGVKGPKDINFSEFFLLLPACALVVIIGLYPKPIIDRIAPTAKHILTIEKTVNVPSDEGGGEHH